MLFEFFRKLLCPFEQIETYIPKKGKIIDVGCGHGIFSRIIAIKSPSRKVLGIDPSAKKILLASANPQNRPNLSFKNIYLEEIREKNFQSIIGIDVLYLFPPGEKERLFRTAKRLLAPQGKLIIKLEVTKPNWLFYLLKLEEKVMVRLLKYTFSDHPQFYYTSPEEYKKLLIKIGFKIQSEKILTSWIPYQHTLLVAIKPVKG